MYRVKLTHFRYFISISIVFLFLIKYLLFTVYSWIYKKLTLLLFSGSNWPIKKEKNLNMLHMLGVYIASEIQYWSPGRCLELSHYSSTLRGARWVLVISFGCHLDSLTCSNHVPPGEGLLGKPRTLWRDHISLLPRGHLGVTPNRSRELSAQTDALTVQL